MLTCCPGCGDTQVAAGWPGVKVKLCKNCNTDVLDAVDRLGLAKAPYPTPKALVHAPVAPPNLVQRIRKFLVEQVMGRAE